MSRCRARLCLVAVVLLLAACGRQGPLRLPDVPPPAPTPDTIAEERQP